MDSTRLLIQLAAAGPLPDEVTRLLDQAGVASVRASHQELPGLYIATVPATANPALLLDQLRQLPCVRHAEADAWRQTS